MLFYPNMSQEKRRFVHALVMPTIISLVIVLLFVLQQGLGWDIESWGVFPRTLSGMKGILLHPFVHADWSHLCNNIVTFYILSVALYYFYRDVANKVLLLLWPGTGLLLWFIGRDNYHIGVSGIVYGLAFFIFWGGVLKRNISLLAISLTVVFWYGSMVWDMFPFLPNEAISWEGHLSGAIVGSLLAIVFRKSKVKEDADLPEDLSENEELTEMAMKYEKEGELIDKDKDVSAREEE